MPITPPLSLTVSHIPIIKDKSTAGKGLLADPISLENLLSCFLAMSRDQGVTVRVDRNPAVFRQRIPVFSLALNLGLRQRDLLTAPADDVFLPDL